MVFSGHQNDSAMKIRPESDSRLQVRCSIEVRSHREPSEVRLVETLSGYLYLLVELCAIPTYGMLLHSPITRKMVPTTGRARSFLLFSELLGTYQEE